MNNSIRAVSKKIRELKVYDINDINNIIFQLRKVQIRKLHGLGEGQRSYCGLHVYASKKQKTDENLKKSGFSVRDSGVTCDGCLKEILLKKHKSQNVMKQRAFMTHLDLEAVRAAEEKIPERSPNFPPSPFGAGRKEIYKGELIKRIILAKLKNGIPVKATCRELGVPYVSIIKAMNRYGIKIPKKGAKLNWEKFTKIDPADFLV